MSVILVLLGLVLIGYGLYAFVKGFFYILKSLTVRFWPEKKMDKELFKTWEKESDYKKFENNIKI